MLWVRLALGFFLCLFLASCCNTVPVNHQFKTYAPTLAAPSTEIDASVGLDVGLSAPDFKLLSETGTEKHLSDFKGRPILLYFWTFCDQCREELPYIQKIFDNRRTFSEDLVILAVNVSQPREQVARFVSYYGYTFEFLLDTWATIASKYYIQKIPTSFFVDRNGIIREVNTEPIVNYSLLEEKAIKISGR